MSDPRRRILIVEDEADLAEPIRAGLEEEGFEARAVAEGRKAVRLLEEHWDLVVLDLMLPDISGESILRYLRQRPDCPPILILTARIAISDRLSLFREGCDDFMCKPFVFEELLERVKALLRRSPIRERPSLRLEGIELDPVHYALRRAGQEVTLTPKETSILGLFLRFKGEIVSRREILHSVWGLEQEPDTNFIGVHLFNLRKKLAKVDCEEWLQTVRHAGFRFGPPA